MKSHMLAGAVPLALAALLMATGCSKKEPEAADAAATPAPEAASTAPAAEATTAAADANTGATVYATPSPSPFAPWQVAQLVA